MNIKRSLSEDGSLAPIALSYLDALPESYVHLHEHARRHPLGIYNVSLDQLEKDFDRLFASYRACVNELKGNVRVDGDLVEDNLNKAGYIDLLQCQKHLIHSLRSHIDDCYAVLSSLVDPATSNIKPAEITFTDKWLKAVKFSSLKSFNDDIAFYKNKYLGPIVNGLKHRQCRLRGLFFYRYFDIRLGYYLEDSDRDGIPGPSPDVHKDRNSAFSFAKDIRINLFHVYKISAALSDAISTELGKTHSFNLQPKRTNVRTEKWQRLFQQLQTIPLHVFPDEFGNVAVITYSESPGREYVELGYPWMIYSPKFPPNMKIKSTFELDGVGKVYKLPYLAPTKFGGVR